MSSKFFAIVRGEAFLHLIGDSRKGLNSSFIESVVLSVVNEATMEDSTVISNAPVKFLIAGMGDTLGTFFEGRASIRTESAGIEGTGITRAG